MSFHPACHERAVAISTDTAAASALTARLSLELEKVSSYFYMANLEIYYWVLKLMKICVHQFLRKQQRRFVITGLMHPAAMLVRVAFVFSKPDTIKNPATTNVVTGFLVGV